MLPWSKGANTLINTRVYTCVEKEGAAKRKEDQWEGAEVLSVLGNKAQLRQRPWKGVQEHLDMDWLI